MKNNNFLNIGAMIVIGGLFYNAKYNGEKICIDKHIVKEVISIKNSDYKVKLDDNSVLVIDDKVVSPGDEYCKEWVNKNPIRLKYKG